MLILSKKHDVRTSLFHHILSSDVNRTSAVILSAIALSALASPIIAASSEEDSSAITPRSITVDLDYTPMDGDYVKLDAQQLSVYFKENIENDPFWDRVVIHSVRSDMGYWTQADESCSIGTFSGQCNVRDARQGMHFTAYNDVYGISIDSDWTYDETTYSAIGDDWYESESVYFEDYYIDYGTLADDEAGRYWENFTIEVSESSTPSSMTVGTIFTISSENWEDWSWVDLNDNGSRVEDSGSEYWMEDTSFEGMQELSIEFQGYNEADSSGSSPTTLSVLQVEVRNVSDGGELVDLLLFTEWGVTAGFYYDAENATDLVPMTMWNNQAGGFPDADGDGCPDEEDAFPDDASECSDFDSDGIGDNADSDDDNDGWDDVEELSCGTDQFDSISYPSDVDSDGLCNGLDLDDDNDGYDDSIDDFPEDPTEWSDNDNDEIGDNADLDDDNDGFSDINEQDCGSDPMSVFSQPLDTDTDGECDVLDSDDDNDGWEDDRDSFPKDPTEWLDTDSDSIGNNADTDDDNDGWIDTKEVECGTGPLDALSYPQDFDGDSLCDAIDTDDDGDKWSDSVDVFPLDPSEWFDTDGDGIGNNADTDDDGDGWSDVAEETCDGDKDDSSIEPTDSDGDGLCDGMDPDRDGDGTINDEDAFPDDPNENLDSDGDGVGNNADLDDDGDGLSDLDEVAAGTDPLKRDTDSDGWDDGFDAFPLNTAEWKDTDGDGVGDNSDVYPNFSLWQTTGDMILSMLVVALFIGLIAGGAIFVSVSRKKPEAQQFAQDYSHQVSPPSPIAMYTDEELRQAGWSDQQIAEQRGK